MRALIFALATAFTVSPSIAADSCLDNTKQENNKRIVQAGAGSLEDWPGFAVLRKRSAASKDEVFFCGGTAIAPDWILTAAHCVVGEDGFTKSKSGHYQDKNDRRLEVVLGVDNLIKVRAPDVYQVKNVIPYEVYYDAERGGDDIALLQLDRPWSGTLSTASQLPKENSAWSLAFRVAGYGALKSGGTLRNFTRADGTRFTAQSADLKQVTLVEVSLARCKQAYADTNFLVGDGHICSGLRRGGDDSCRGDSGGPLVVIDANGCPRQVGIVSWGVGCGRQGRYGVYTRVSHYEEWIRKHTLERVKIGTTLVVPDQERGARLFAEIEQALPSTHGTVAMSLGASSQVRIGNMYQLRLESSVTGKLVLLDVGAGGQITQLLPNAFSWGASTFVKAGEVITVPTREEFGFDAFEATPPTGHGTVIALVAPELFPTEVALDATSLQHTKPLLPLPVTTRDKSEYLVALISRIIVTRELQAIFSGDTDEGWGYGTLDYEIVR